MHIPCNKCRYHIFINHSIGSVDFCHQCKVDNYSNHTKFNKEIPFPEFVNNHITYSGKNLERKFLYGYWPFCLKKYEFTRVSVITLIISISSFIFTFMYKFNKDKLVFSDGITMKDNKVTIDSLYIKKKILELQKSYKSEVKKDNKKN